MTDESDQKIELHVMRIGNALKKIFGDEIDLSDVKAKGKEDAYFTRALAAFAIYAQADCTPEAAARSVTDGYKDNGIDTIYYDKLRNHMWIVQPKWVNSCAQKTQHGMFPARPVVCRPS